MRNSNNSLSENLKKIIFIWSHLLNHENWLNNKKTEDKYTDMICSLKGSYLLSSARNREIYKLWKYWIRLNLLESCNMKKAFDILKPIFISNSWEDQIKVLLSQKHGLLRKRKSILLIFILVVLTCLECIHPWWIS